MNLSGSIAETNGSALIPAVVAQSGEHVYTTENGTIWEYDCEIDAPGTPVERRSSRLHASGIRLEGARAGDTVATPWGTMQRLPDSDRERGWQLQGARRPLPETHAGTAIRVPDEALSRAGVWTSAVGAWRYRVYAGHLGTPAEQRTGWLAYRRAPVWGNSAGELLDTPWGALAWTGTGQEEQAADFEQGWLLRGVADRPLVASRRVGARPHALPGLQVRSPYLPAGVALSWDTPIARGIALHVEGWLGDETARGRLHLDPNVSTLNDFGDRGACTRIAIRSYDVAVTRLRLADPAHLDRRLYAITGASLPERLMLILYPYGDRMYLRHETTLVPLYFEDGAP